MAYFYYGNLMGLQWVCVRTCPNPFISGMVTWVTYGLQSLVNEGSRWSGKTRQIRELPAPLSPPALCSPPSGAFPSGPAIGPSPGPRPKQRVNTPPAPRPPQLKGNPSLPLRSAFGKNPDMMVAATWSPLSVWHLRFHSFSYGYGSIPISTIFSVMNIHLPAILRFTRGTRFWHCHINE